MIDLKTVFVCIMHISLFYSVVYALFWFSQKTYKGFGCWTLATLSYSGIYGAVLMRLVIPEGISITVVALLIPLSSVLYADAVLRFVRDRELPWYAYMVAPMAIPLNMYFYYGEDSFAMRNAVLLLSLTPFNFITCKTLLSYHPDTGRVLYRIGGGFFVMRYVGMAFGVASLFASKGYNHVFNSPDMGAYLLFTMFGVLGAGSFFFIIHAHRSQEDRYNAAMALERMSKAAQGTAQGKSEPVDGLY